MSLIEMSINSAVEPSAWNAAESSAPSTAALSDTGVLQAMKGEGNCKKRGVFGGRI